MTVSLDLAISEGLMSYRKRLVAKITLLLGERVPPAAELRRTARDLRRLEWHKLHMTSISINGHSSHLGYSASISAIASADGGWDYVIRYRGRTLKTRRAMNPLVAIRKMGF